MRGIMADTTLKGVLSLCAGVAVFSLQDTILKFLSGLYPLTEAMTFRGVVALPLLAAIVVSTEGLPALGRDVGFLLLRAVVLFVAYFAYYLAIPAMPLADAASLYFTVPLFVAIIAGPYLGEEANWKVWAAIALGLIGVIVMLRPGAGVFEPAALLSLLSAVAYAFGQLMARKRNATTSAFVFAFWQTLFFLVIGLALAALFHLANFQGVTHPSAKFLVREWVLPSARDGALMASCGIIAAAGSVLLVRGYQLAAANTVAAFEYTGLLWVSMMAFLVFAEVPRVTTLIGAGLIVTAGILALRSRT